MGAAASQLGQSIRPGLRKGLCASRLLSQALQVNLPTRFRALQALGDDHVLVSAAQSIQHPVINCQHSPLPSMQHGIAPEGPAALLVEQLHVQSACCVTPQAAGRQVQRLGV